MKCKKIQELILTDYLDDELDENKKDYIEQHLVHCHQCKEFSIIARDAVIKPFANLERVCAPESNWTQVREAILAEQSCQTNFIADFWEKLKLGIYIPKPVFAGIVVMILILTTGIGLQVRNNNQVVKAKGQAQIEYLSYLVDDSVGISPDDEQGFGTKIEEYFL